MSEVLLESKRDLGHLIGPLRLRGARFLEIRFSLAGPRQLEVLMRGHTGGKRTLGEADLRDLAAALSANPELLRRLDLISDKTGSGITLKVPVLENGAPQIEMLDLDLAPARRGARASQR